MRCAKVLWVIALAGCVPAKTTPAQRQVPVAAPGTLSCPSDAPMDCPAGCCDSGDACGVSGCDLPPTTPSCPPDSPVYCSTARAADSSPNGNDLSLAAPADFIVGSFSSGVSVECAQNSSCAPSITGPLHGLAGTGLTIEAWVRPAVFDSSVMSIVSLNGLTLAITADSEQSSLWLFGGISEYVVHGVPRFDDSWHFVAVTFAPNPVPSLPPSAPPNFFLDGVAVGAASAETGSSAGAAGVIIGNNGAGMQPFFGGIDEVRVLGAAAAASQIAADFAGGPMTAIPGTIALWHFDDPVQGWCCATGSSCGANAGDCLAPTDGPAACPSSTPVQCPSGCCPAGSGCDSSGSCNVGVSACPAGALVDCGDGTCCGTGYTCAASGCVLNPPTPAPSPACPAGTSPATNSTTQCCPSSMSAVYCAGKCVPGGTCASVACTTSCTNGYSCVCQNPNPCTPCQGNPSPTLCASLCGGACCGPGETCNGTKCCPSGTAPCGAACCPASQCSAGTCTTAKTPPASCPANTAACGNSCCPSGSLCVSGVCVTPPVPATYCTRGLACGGQCCLGVSCSATGECVQLTVAPFGPCLPGCYGGRAASVGGGRSAPLVCHCNAKKPPHVTCADAKAPTACGSVCCTAGNTCTSDHCGCPTNHPLRCGDNCCLAGASCSGGQCACPTGHADCGTACCDAGQACVNGTCQAAGGSTSTTGSGGGDCVAFGQQNCMPADGARCYNGHCQCCWAQCGSGTGACTCYGCIDACGARGYSCSSDGTCIFPPPPEGPACSN